MNSVGRSPRMGFEIFEVNAVGTSLSEIVDRVDSSLAMRDPRYEMSRYGPSSHRSYRGEGVIIVVRAIEPRTATPNLLSSKQEEERLSKKGLSKTQSNKLLLL